jgi:transcriptional regulator with XRE-family HTH domain
MSKRFVQLLDEHITASGIKHVHLASVAGISYNYLTRLLAGTRHPSDQVICGLARALRLSSEQTAELFSSAGFPPPITLLIESDHTQQAEPTSAFSSTDSMGAEKRINRLMQQFHRLFQEVPETLQPAFLEEMRCLLGYARYKYVLSSGTPLLDLDHLSNSTAVLSPFQSTSDEQTHLDVIAQIVGELQAETGESAEGHRFAEDTLTALDQLIGHLFTGDVSATSYHPQVVTQTLDMLAQGAPWEIRRRVTEALPSLCRLDVAGAIRLMEALRTDLDVVRGADIRRRVIEALPILFETAPQSLPAIIRLLQPRPEDDIYVALATVEACGDIQVSARFLLERKEDPLSPDLEESIHDILPEVARIQRHILVNWDGGERESLQLSMALHNLLPAPDTLLISLQEGLQSQEKLIQLVSVRYLERVLPVRPAEALKLYLSLPHIALHKNVRRSVAKALPVLLHCLKETSLATRALARSVLLMLAEDPDIPIRRAVADHAMQIFSIDREFLLVLLRRMRKDTDQAIRYRLRPVALCLAQVWLAWYAETAGLVDMAKRGHTQAIKQPFGE